MSPESVPHRVPGFDDPDEAALKQPFEPLTQDAPAEAPQAKTCSSCGAAMTESYGTWVCLACP